MRLKTLFLLISFTLSTSVLSNETQTPQLILLEWKSSEIVTDSEGKEHCSTRESLKSTRESLKSTRLNGLQLKSTQESLHKSVQVFPPIEMIETKRVKIKHIDANTFEVLHSSKST